MKKIGIFFLIVCMLQCFFLTTPTVVRSEPTLQEQIDQLEEKKKREEAAQEDYKRTIEAERKKTESLQHKKDDLTKELSSFEENIANLQYEIEQLHIEEENLRKIYIITEQEISLLEESIRLKELQLDGLINALYRDYCSRLNKYLFSSSNINEILDKGIYLKYLYETDREFFSELKSNKALLAEKKDSYIEDQIRNLEVKKEIKEKYEELEMARQKKDEEIRNIQRLASQSQNMVEKSFRALAESEATVQRIISETLELNRLKSLKNKSMGALIWPIQGVVSSEFGMRMHPIFGVYRMHTGIDIDQRYGYPIKAVADGSVAFSGWLTGYGNCVLIQHDYDHSTLYAHMNRRSVSKDQEVVQGEVIGEVGSTGWSTGPHLHFEVRKNGDYVNPRDYLP
ncbi:MAG: peptidoglycan DD-metalloendopeptidase family protein [Caldisericia bacterium]|nr:peptidoglycan DD-metalloendopeptidase family protein [Caldisericia bacterium]